MEVPPATLKTTQRPKTSPNGSRSADELVEQAHTEADAVLKALGSRANGLSTAEVEACARKFGPNAIAREKKMSVGQRLLDNVKNPLVILLTALGVISFL